MNLSSNFFARFWLSVALPHFGWGVKGLKPRPPRHDCRAHSRLGRRTPVVLRSFKEGALVNVAKTQLDATGAFALTPEPAISMGYHQLLVGASYCVDHVPSESVFVDATAHEARTTWWTPPFPALRFQERGDVLQCHHAASSAHRQLESAARRGILPARRSEERQRGQD